MKKVVIYIYNFSLLKDEIGLDNQRMLKGLIEFKRLEKNPF